MKKIFNCSLVLLLSTFFSIKVFALSGTPTEPYLRIRSGAGTSYAALCNDAGVGVMYTLIDSNEYPTDDGSTGCESGTWYKISYNNQIGYICSRYFSIITPAETTGGSGDFAADLEKFPVSYRTYIEQLHDVYPNASFSVLNTGLDWNTVLQNEDYIRFNGSKFEVRSLIQTQNDGYKSTDNGIYDWSTNVWSTNISGGGSSWYAAKRDVIAYYMDPRNFLTYNSSFMFLNHGYSNNITYTESAINGILSGSFMANSMTNDNTHTFAQTFIIAGQESGISPYYLASRVIQEIGRSSTRSAYVDGKYNGYYNYYNIDANGGSNLANALNRAKNEGWDNDYKAIIGGAKFIANGYVKTGQTTLYLEKWDVVNGGNGFYSHQYMQNVQATVSEAGILYSAYVRNNLLGSSMEFLIPVYNNMPASTALPNKGNPNNYLKNITINGYGISGFNMDKLEYNYNVSSVVESVEIGASKVANTASVSGTGTISITSDSFVHEIVVTAGNGQTKKYKINFTRDDNKPISVSDIVSSKGYVSDGTYISGITVGSSAEKIVEKLNVNNNVSVIVTDGSGNSKTGTIVTGDKVTITSGEETKTYTMIIRGDTNGDGKISSSDYVFIKNYIMGTKNLNSAQKVAGDINKDNKVSSSDYVFVKNHIMGVSSIAQ